MPLKFKLYVILITGEREYAQNKGNQPKETSEGIKGSDKFGIGTFCCDEIEAKELKHALGDKFLGHSHVCHDRYGVEEEVGDHKYWHMCNLLEKSNY